MKRILTILILLLAIGCSSQKERKTSSWLYQSEGDLTPENSVILFRNLEFYQKRHEHQFDVNKLKGYKIIFVKGIFTNLYGNIFRNLAERGVVSKGLLDPMILEYRWLKSLGLDVSFAPINTEAGPKENGDLVAKEIKKSDKDVIIISHSKGGVDVLFGLIRNKEIQGKVKGWLNMQAPIHGGHISDLVVGSKYALGPLYRFASWLIKGDHKSMTDITTMKMKKFHQENKRDIITLLGRVPTLSIAGGFKVPSFFEGKSIPFSEKTGLEATNRIIHFMGGGDNDGLTATWSSCFHMEQETCWIIRNFDHAAPVTSMAPFYHYLPKKRQGILKTFLARLVQKMED